MVSNVVEMENELRLFWFCSLSVAENRRADPVEEVCSDILAQARSEIEAVARHSRWGRLRAICSLWLDRNPATEAEAVA